MVLLKNRSPVKTTGFTIVELLIVIVIIGILAAITILAFNGVTQRATVASLQSDLTNSAQKLSLYQLDNSAFPTSIDCSTSPPAGSTCLKSSSSNVLTTYYADNTFGSQSFCMTITNNTNVYSVAQDNKVTNGGCVITNMVTNPNFETSILGYDPYNSASLSQLASGCQSGKCLAVNVSGGNSRGIIYQTPTAQPINTYYVFSAYVKGPAGQTFSISGRSTDAINSYLGEGVGGISYTYTGNWQRVFTNPVLLTSPSTRPGLQIVNDNSSVGTFYVDSVMMTRGSTLYNYADGNSTGWTWSGGTANANTVMSSGQPV